jgi:hypothetical protein
MATKLGFENKETLATESAQTVRELIDYLEDLCRRVEKDTDVVYVENGSTEPVTLRLVEHTLTDGSKVYDIRIS